MAGMKFEYDENGATFAYFVLSFYAMIIIPLTYSFWPRREVKSKLRERERERESTSHICFNLICKLKQSPITRKSCPCSSRPWRRSSIWTRTRPASASCNSWRGSYSSPAGSSSSCSPTKWRRSRPSTRSTTRSPSSAWTARPATRR